MDETERFLREAVALAQENVRAGGRPFGAVVVKDSEVVGRGVNRILATNDPTAHAELLAIRAAAETLGTPRLDGCAVYASGQPCPMCLAAMHLSGIRTLAYAWSNADAEPYGLSTAALSAQLARPLSEQGIAVQHLPLDLQGEHPYSIWAERQR